MGFKKHHWMVFNRSGEVLEIAIKGQMGERIDFFRCNNNKDLQNIVGIIKDKYGFNFQPEIKEEDSVNFKKRVEEERAWLDKQ
ncbi:MAG TPA: hypothetical protein ENG87_05820 [Candidatus Pacearchaeota archaeon]|nr:hypothetical protein BMS3Abin17_00082 [archaeon BMS3Abin17]HDK42873.1 hypothetical protein [Candidatus Pacearchaeota archaeon]HDZ60170.1 hypothetical protein [Candidatus Pacearchaeota archaeon]